MPTPDEIKISMLTQQRNQISAELLDWQLKANLIQAENAELKKQIADLSPKPSPDRKK